MVKDTADKTTDSKATAEDQTATESVPQDVGWDLLVQQSVEQEGTGGLTTTIVTAVAEAEGIEPRHLKHPPLFEVVDTAALEAAFFGNQGNVRTHDPNSSTEFMYRDYRVVVRSDGWVQVYERAED